MTTDPSPSPATVHFDPISTTSPAPVKPGYLTTEFYAAWAVKIFGALMTSGVLGDGTPASRIVGAALTILAFFGYTYSRTAIKTAAPMLVALLLAGHTTACSSPVVKTAGRIAWDCTSSERKEAVDILTPLATNAILNGVSPDGKHVDLTALKSATSKASLLTDVGVTLWCAASEAVAAIANPPAAPAGSPQTAPLDVDPAALRGAWQSIKPDAAFVTGVKDSAGNQVVM